MSRGGSKSGSRARSPAPKSWPAAVVETRELAKIRMRPGNPNMHSLEQVEQIAASMDRFGWTIPMLVDESDELIAGEGRFRAARLKGWQEGPVMVARGWSEEDKRAYVIIDNNLARNSEWDDKKLRVELRTLVAAEFDMKLIGFSDEELQKLVLDPPKAAAVEPEDVHMKRCPTCGSLRRKTDP